MSRLWMSPQVENDVLTEVARRRQALALKATQVTPALGQAAGIYADAYPWMDGDLINSFLQAGLQPDDPRVQEAASYAAQDVNTVDQNDEVADSWYGSLWHVLTAPVRGAYHFLTGSDIVDPVKAVSRAALTVLMAPGEEFGALASSVLRAQRMPEFDSAGERLSHGALNPVRFFEDFWNNFTSKAAHSGLFYAVGAALDPNQHVDLGEGYFPGSYTPETMGRPDFTGGIYGMRDRAKHRLSIDGQFVTPGRMVARNVTEPGTTAYNVLSGAVDFSVGLWGDPANAGLAKIASAREAAQAFHATGLISGIRKTVSTEKGVQYFLDSNTGRKMTQWLTDVTDPYEIWRATGKADIGLAHTLARTATPTETADVLKNALGTVIREKPTAGFVSRQIGRRFGGDYGAIFGGGAVVTRKLDAMNTRIFRDLPAAKLNVWDVNQAATDLEAWMRNAKMGDSVIAKHVGAMSEIQNGDAASMLAVAQGVMKDAKGFLTETWAPKKVLRAREALAAGELSADGAKAARATVTGWQRRVRDLTRMVDDYASDHRSYQVDDLGREVDALAPFRVTIDGNNLDVSPTAGIVADLIGTNIPLPDARDIRRATPTIHMLQGAYESGLWNSTMDWADSVQKYWKYLQLLRMAYTTRVIGEEQIRMASSGFDSLASSPLRAIAWTVGVDPSSRLGRSLAKLAKIGIDPKGATTVTGELWDDFVEYTNALSRGSAGHAGLPGEILTGRWVRATQADEGFYRAWAARLGHVANDPVMRRMAAGLTDADIASIRRGFKAGKLVDDAFDWTSNGNRFDDVAEWFWSGTGQEWRHKLAQAHGELGAKMVGDSPEARRFANAYLKQNFESQLRRLTGDNPELMNLVATGKLDDVSLRQLGNEGKLARVLESSYAEAAPNYVPMEDFVRTTDARLKSLQGLDRKTEKLFNMLMSQPTNQLSRSPTFRQLYWRRVNELIDTVPEGVQKQMIKAAGESLGTGDALVRDMAARAVKGAGSQLESLDQVDAIAKAFALDGTKKLLYDLSKRSQFFDMARLIFPFGEAWKEIITAWGRIMYENPRAIRRAQQLITGARGGDQDPSTGFFHTDPQTGEEVFTYPVLGSLGKAVLGLPTGQGGSVAFTGRVAGLNLASTTVLPGFGPAVQIPAAWIIPNTPTFDDLRKAILPFGEQKNPLKAFEPAWVAKLQTAFFDRPESSRLFANTVMDVMRALHASGRYPIDNQSDINKLLDTSRTKARWLYFIRGLAQSGVPTGPAFSWSTTDVEGNVVPMKLLSDELRRMTTEEYGGDRNAAFLEWTRRFGVDNVLAVMSKSQELVDRPVTSAGDDWLRAHQSLERNYPMTVGLFAPEDPVGQFDYNAYLRQFDTGARKPILPEEMVALANDFLGRLEYEQARKVASIRPGPESALWLSQVRDQIAQRRPGFDGWIPARVRAQRPEVDQQIAELQRAVTEQPELANSDAGQGTLAYLQARDMANLMVRGMPGNITRFQQAKGAAPVRAWLRQTARDIIGQHPDFARVWTSVFDRELADDSLAQPGGF